MRIYLSALIIFISILKTSEVYCQNPKDLIFVLDQRMIKEFDSLTFEIRLTDSAKVALEKMDFTNYSYLWIPFNTTLIQILPWTLELRPQVIFLYRDIDNSIVTGGGKIRIVIDHLDKSDKRVVLLKKFLYKEL